MSVSDFQGLGLIIALRTCGRGFRGKGMRLYRHRRTTWRQMRLLCTELGGRQVANSNACVFGSEKDLSFFLLSNSLMEKW